MKIFIVTSAIIIAAFCFSFSLQPEKKYDALYSNSVNEFEKQLIFLSNVITTADLTTTTGRDMIREEIRNCRLKMKGLDFWFRYFEPNVYRKINGPLPVEWENEVFEKFEPPYRREGAGLTLAEQYLDEAIVNKDSLSQLITLSVNALATFKADSITRNLESYHHFFLANRLYLLNLAALYTTGFECPDTNNIVPELRAMSKAVKEIYDGFDETFASTPVSKEYLSLYDQTIDFISNQPAAFSRFDHFVFIKDYINPLFKMNQQAINKYGVISRNYNDYSLNDNCFSIFDKSLYTPQNTMGIFSLVEDEKILKEIKATGKLLFYDPILSANNRRSCASCHKPDEYFTDTTLATAIKIDGVTPLTRNIPTLINVIYNHLIMLDGKLISLQAQINDVLHNEEEFNNDEKEVIRKIMSCKEYKDVFKKFLKYTPEEKEVGLSHIGAAITYYYSDFSNYSSPFDDAMNNKLDVSPDVKRGFNLYMSKAQCATCHFVPVFNGVKPPFIGSEFEVIGVPDDSGYHQLSDDKGRFGVNPAKETINAFRTGTVRNTAFTKPYMHNGVFQTLEQVIDLYDAGGGTGKKLTVNNQTLSPDSLKLTASEKKDLIAFIHSLNENIIFEQPPPALPSSSNKELNRRKVGGEY
ncbi:MAG TPA: cytochrome c peroxidase [Chitinophagaceae bacterium]|nr:cytochrome c peroxidase [Chitinophagaceae bacterium]